MEVYDCHKSKYNCKSRVKKCGKCGEKICFNVKCPPPIMPLFPSCTVDHRTYTVGGGSGPLANLYTVSIPLGTQSITVRTIGAGGGGGGQLSEIFLFTGQLVPIPQTVQGGGGGGSGLREEITRPYCGSATEPTTLNITVGNANPVPTDPATGIGNDGNDSLVTFTPLSDGFEEVRGKGGKGGGVGRSIGDGEGEAGNGFEGGNGGGGGGGGIFLLAQPDPVILPFGTGGIGINRESGTDGDNTDGGDGGLNPNSGSSGSVSVETTFGGGGGGGSGVLVTSSGGVGGPAGDNMNSNAGGDFQIQNTGAGGGGVGIYLPELAEVGSILSVNGGLGAHGLVDIWFTIFPIPT